MEYKQIRDKLVTITIPLIIGGILGFLEVFGKEYITPILLIGLAVIILCIVVYYAIRFLEAREKRWQGNKEVHQKLTERVRIIEENIKDIQRNQKIDEKINILENQIKYIKGRIEK